jgi:hypothetical protein
MGSMLPDNGTRVTSKCVREQRGGRASVEGVY